ncbi:MAG: hypothetical protein M3319_05470, partial [Actinomycetota bacterium]|nr:hypothetical protein [Actinomycetota bacterium]
MGATTGRIFTSLVLATVIMASAVPAQSGVPAIPALSGIRTATHPTFDRIVLDLPGPRPQVSSRFVDELTRDGSGEVE